MRRPLVLAIAALALVLAGCGGGGSTASSASDRNDQDVAFVRDMIPHHAQAIEMSDMAATRGTPEVQALAAKIKAAQGPEIELMRGWLTSWGEREHASSGGGHGGHGGHGGSSGGAGMMSAGQLEQMGRLSGPDFDEAFLRSMVEHHEGAVAMADDQIAKGRFVPAKELAQRIKADQEREIQEMRGLLASS